MQVLIYEHVTGGGLLSSNVSSTAADLQPLHAEGDAMASGLAADFADVPGVEVHLMRDSRLSEPPLSVHLHRVGRPTDELATLTTLAARVDWTVLIAPEIDDILLTRARLVEDAGGRLLSPPSGVVELCTDKRQTSRHLAAAGIPVPRTLELEGEGCGRSHSLRAFVGPAVLKRIDGAGSLGMRLVERASPDALPQAGRWMLEEFRPGIAASAAVLCGPGGNVVLPPFAQHLQPQTLAYQGGSRLVGWAVQRRAEALAARVADALPEAVGYLGVDLILGEDRSGGDDCVIEVNPRLTTSWVGLRAIACTNLAAAMLTTAEGTPQIPRFATSHVCFSSDGTVKGGRHALQPRRQAC